MSIFFHNHKHIEIQLTCLSLVKRKQALGAAAADLCSIDKLAACTRRGRLGTFQHSIEICSLVRVYPPAL